MAEWNIQRVTAVIGAVCGIILSILAYMRIFGPFGGLVANDSINLGILIGICCVIIIGWGVLSWDNTEFHNFIIFIVVGAVVIIVFGNLAGILLIAAGLFVALAS